MRVTHLVHCLMIILQIILVQTTSSITPLEKRLPEVPIGKQRMSEQIQYLRALQQESNSEYCKKYPYSSDCPHCSIKINYPIIDGPVLLSGDNSFLLNPGEDGHIKLKYFEKLILACPEDNETSWPELDYPIKLGDKAACLNGDVLFVDRPATDGLILSLGDLKCKSRVPGSVEVTSRKCARGKGQIVKIGFKVKTYDEDIFFYPLLHVCHDVANAETLWSKHTIQGNANGEVGPTKISPNSRDKSILYMSFDPEIAYLTGSQLHRFKSLLGPNKLESYLAPRQNLTLIRGHLAPTADLYLWPMVSEMYLNTVPMWKSISEGSWQSIESGIRDLVKKAKAKFEVFTGTDGVLELEDDSSKLKGITLVSGKLPVPAVIWKVVRNADTDSCIVFVVFNNPHLTQPPPLWCRDICKATNWPSFQSDFKKGYVYCCDVDDIRTKIQHSISEYLHCDSLLDNNY